MPRGGKRPGCGPKKDANGKALNPYKPRSVESSKRRQSSNSSNDAARTPVIEAKVVSDNRRQPMFSDSAIMAILETTRELASQAKKRPRTRAWNPYVIRNERFGPVWDHILKNKRKRQIAMDDNTPLSVQNQFAIQAWQTGGIGPNDATDGMLFLGYPYLSELSQRAEFRLFGEITSEEMTRKWIDLRGTDDESTKEKDKPKERNKDDQEASDRRLARDEEPRTDGRNKEIEAKIIELRQFADEMHLRQWFKSIDAQDQYFGISHLYLDLKGANGDDLHDPENRLPIGNGRDAASEGKLGRGCLRGLRTIEPVWCYPIAYNASNPLSPDWYDPQVWYVMGAEVHKSRLMPFISRPVADILKPAYAFGGLPMTQMAQPYVDIWLRTRESVAELIHAFSVMVMKTNLGTITQPGGAGGANGDVIARMMLANTLRDNQGMMIIDKNTEDFVNIAAPISGLDHLQAQAQEHMYCCEAGTLVETDRGQVPIEKVTAKDRVMTRKGFAPINWVGQTGVASELVEIRTRDSLLRVTGWHPIWSATTNEFVSAENVDRSHCLLKSTNWENMDRRSFGEVDGGGKPRMGITAIRRRAACFIETFMKRMSVQSQKASTFTISMMTATTTILRILNCFRIPSTWRSMLALAGSGSIGSIEPIGSSASNVGRNIRHFDQNDRCFVHENVSALGTTNVECEIESVLIVSGPGEPVFNIEVEQGFLPEFYANGMLVHNSVARIPAVKWTGIQPTGLNATSEGELRAFNDTIHGRQESFFRTGLTTVLDIMQISLWGKRDPDITFDFEALHELTEKEKAEVDKMKSETDQIRVDSGIVSQEEVRGKLVADPDSGFHGLDPDDVPELLQEEEQGLIPQGAGKGLQAELEEGGGTPGKPPGGSRKPGAPPSRGNGAARRPGEDAGDGGGGAHNESHKSGAKKATPLKA